MAQGTVRSGGILALVFCGPKVVRTSHLQLQFNTELLNLHTLDGRMMSPAFCSAWPSVVVTQCERDPEDHPQFVSPGLEGREVYKKCLEHST